ncbi:NAD/NADP octopine/nopaline dehydrogenase [Candidatus Rhodobacter oscarellae]|uniref:NAD/NADP octopine/nopaline dehydrogenase n=1 Tax=Candidatus Rhodobacter oscarellae TaxID=1675527 RepID=A0A0J9E9L6_9RHOB|nr:hypothetical protein [Candidatus Rhodobacter lobularis]KMW59321.1 NAD/NADP octopine/nopaline dehydrogenase [Candidatus Rhodobacter lobularis]
MSNPFADFAEAASSARRTSLARDVPQFSKIAVLGGGADARLIAALCLSEGAEVTLFSAYGAELEAMRASSGITLRGAGPVGTYHVDRPQGPSVKLTAELDAAVKDAELIFLTGPVHKQRTYAMVLADHLQGGQVIVLPGGRTFGALETAWYLRIGGATADFTIVETQGLPYWIRSEGAVLHLSQAGAVGAATLPSGREHVLAAVTPLIAIQPPHPIAVNGFHDGSALVEFPALLMSGPALGSGAQPIPMGGQPLPENQSFASLIGPEQRRIIEQLAEERRSVGHAFGTRSFPDTDDWIDLYAGGSRGEAARPVPDQESAKQALRDGVIGSLVPLVSAARLTGTKVPVTEAMITLASSVLGADVAAAGRRLDTIGITATDASEARRQMDKIAGGAHG